MKKPKKSEKLLLKGITNSATVLRQQQKGLKVGQLIALIRSQLRMSQRMLSRRARVPQSTISKIESGNLEPNISTLNNVLDAMHCDLLISVIPREELEEVRRKQAVKRAKDKIRYLRGTMSLEKQEPSEDLLLELVEEETNRLLESPGSKLWDDRQ